MAAALELTRSSRPDGAVVVAVAGEVDLTCAQVLEDELRDACAAAPESVVVDMRQLSFIDSSGLHALVRARAHAERNGVTLALALPPPPMRRTFAVAGVDTAFTIVELG